MPPAQKAEEPRSLRMTAAARQWEMKVSMTEVATTMRTRLEPVGEFEVDDMQREP